MARLSQNSLPCERKRGCSFADDFESQANVEANGGIISGAPAFDVKNGVTLYGTPDRCSYNLTGLEFNTPNISIVVDFTPTFLLADGVHHNIIDTTPGSRTIIRKDGTNRINVFLGATTHIVTIAYVDVLPYWNELARNTIVVSATSGANNVYLNGVLIGTSAIAWVPQPDVVTLYVGSEIAGGYFEGIIHSLKVFKSLLTAQEAQDYSDQTIYSYRNEQALHLPMRMSEHDPANTRTLDIVGTNHLDFGVGAAEPTKLGKHGYNLDGGDYFQSAIPTNIFDSDPLSIVVEFTPDFPYDEAQSRYLIDAEDGAGNNRNIFYHNNGGNNYVVRLGGTTIGTIAEAVIASLWLQNQRNVLVISSTSRDTDVYLNGTLIMDSDNTAWAPTSDTARLTIGAIFNGTGRWRGDIHSFQVWHRKLTQLQVWDIWLDVLKKGNDI